MRIWSNLCVNLSDVLSSASSICVMKNSINAISLLLPFATRLVKSMPAADAHENRYRINFDGQEWKFECMPCARNLHFWNRKSLLVPFSLTVFTNSHPVLKPHGTALELRNKESSTPSYALLQVSAAHLRQTMVAS